MTEVHVEIAMVTSKAPLRALGDVTIRWFGGEVTIRRCAVFEKPAQPPWASLPRLPIEKDRKRAYVPLIDLPRELKSRVLNALLAEYRRKCDAH